MSEIVSGTREYDLGPENPKEAQDHYARMSTEERIAELLKKDNAIRRLHSESRGDPLTGALNRRGFAEQYDMTVARHRRQSETTKPDLLVIFDLDRFKRINDRGGHEAGDTALKETVGILGVLLRSNDVIGRLGGDEFGAILSGVTMEEGAEILERVRYDLETFHSAKTKRPETGLPDMPTLSVGFAEIDDSKSFDEMADMVDAALYDAKGGGRNQVLPVPAQKAA